MIRPMAKDVMIDVKMLVNPKKFYKVQHCVDLSASRDTINTITGSKRPVINNLAIGINNMTDNIAIILQTLKNKCVINIDPAQQDIEVVREQLEDVLVNLRDKIKHSYDEVISLVVGGRAYDISNPFADKERELIDEISKFLNDEQIPSTKLLEQNIGRHSKGIDIHSHREDAILSGGIINNFSISDINTPEKLQETGEKIFGIFEVSPHAPISIVDEITPKFGTNSKYL